MDTRNATSNWSGYLHQGKVGLFLLLNQMRTLIDDKKSYQDWYIEYESAEDIDIKKIIKQDIDNKNSTNQVISRHQVKAYKNGEYPNDYASVLGVLTYSFNGKKKKIETKGFQICEFDEEGKPQKIDVAEDARFLHTIKKVKGFGLDKDKFIESYPGGTKFVSNPNKIRLFEYPDKNEYCELSDGNSIDKLAEFCIDEIKKILGLLNDPLETDGDRHKKIYHYLLYILDSEIRTKHKNGGYPVLYFKKILEIIQDKSDIVEKHIATIRTYFVREWGKFLEEQDELGRGVATDKEKKFDRLIQNIYELEDERFIQFFRDINPDKYSENKNLTAYEMIDLCRVDSFRDIFFECLVQVELKNFDQEYVGYREDGGYLLTLINRKPAKVDTVIKEIMSNRKATQSLFSRKYLVNSQIDDVVICEKISQLVTNGTTNNWNEQVTVDNRFSHSNIAFINIEHAINKLNEGEEKNC